MRINTIIGISAMLFGAVYSLQAFQLPRAMIGAPLAPLYFPLGLGGLMITLGLLLVIKELAAKNKTSAAKKKKELDPGYIRLIVGTCIFCVIYAMVLEHIGFIISTLFLLGGILFLVNGRQAWKINSAVTVTFTLGIWYVFNNVLAITLP